MTIRSPQAIRLLLDNIVSGMSWRHAMAGIGARSEAAGWEWKRLSKEAEAAGDTSSIFYLDWPLGSEPDYLHNLLDKARDLRGALLATPLLRGEFAVVDGKPSFQKDDFGQIVLDDFGLPIAENVVLVEPPTPRPWKLRREGPPRRELAPSSYSTNKPKEVPVPAYVGSALGDYLKGSKMTVDKQPSPMREELEAKLAEARANPNRASAKPTHPVQILGRDREPPENISRPSDQRGLPQTAEVSREPSRPAYAKPPRLDGARVPPPGGFKVG
jgi:hypothetical protein